MNKEDAIFLRENADRDAPMRESLVRIDRSGEKAFKVSIFALIIAAISMLISLIALFKPVSPAKPNDQNSQVAQQYDAVDDQDHIR